MATNNIQKEKDGFKLPLVPPLAPKKTRTPPPKKKAVQFVEFCEKQNNIKRKILGQQHPQIQAIMKMQQRLNPLSGVFAPVVEMQQKYNAIQDRLIPDISVLGDAKPLLNISKSFKVFDESPMFKFAEQFAPFRDLEPLLKWNDKIYNNIVFLPLLKWGESATELLREFHESKEEVKNNLYVNLLEDENKELKRKIKAIEKKIKQREDIIIELTAEKHELKQLQPPKKSTKSKPYINNELNMYQVKYIYKQMKPFILCSFEQWRNLFVSELSIYAQPMRLISGFKIKDLRLFFDLLVGNGEEPQYIISKRGLFVNIERCRAFEYEGKTITAQQFKNAGKSIKNNPKSVHREHLEKIVKELKYKV